MESVSRPCGPLGVCVWHSVLALSNSFTPSSNIERLKAGIIPISDSWHTAQTSAPVAGIPGPRMLEGPVCRRTDVARRDALVTTSSQRNLDGRKGAYSGQLHYFVSSVASLMYSPGIFPNIWVNSMGKMYFVDGEAPRAFRVSRY